MQEDDRQIAAFFRALGHPTRLMIVKGLLEGRRCVGEVEGLLHISQANTSQHLNVLKANGIVDCVREGSSRCYFLKDPECVQKILGVLAQRKG